MCGNEILYNMTNHVHFRNTELINSVYEFSRRLQLPENQNDKFLANYDWLKHPYFKRIFKDINNRIPIFNVK